MGVVVLGGGAIIDYIPSMMQLDGFLLQQQGRTIIAYIHFQNRIVRQETIKAFLRRKKLEVECNERNYIQGSDNYD